MGIRAALLTKPIFAWAKTALPALSDTEREAIEAGDTWWDADLFTGSPDWNKLLANAPAVLFGNAFAARLPLGPIRYLASALFLALGVFFIVRGLTLG